MGEHSRALGRPCGCSRPPSDAAVSAGEPASSPGSPAGWRPPESPPAAQAHTRCIKV